MRPNIIQLAEIQRSDRKHPPSIMASISRIFVNGFPGLYGGAGTELHHQILVWLSLGVEVNLIPTFDHYQAEPLYAEMLNLGVLVHPHNDWSVVQSGDPVIGFCNADFLNNLHEIRKRTRRTIFVNCMTWLFPKEKERMSNGEIAMFLYQNQEVLASHEPQLRALNGDPEIQFMSFKPYFDADRFPFHKERKSDYFGCGRISRQDADKFAKNTLHIYEYFVAPKFKRALFLGFDHRAEEKIGKPYDWIRTARDHSELSQKDFYQHCEIILQPTDTTENWPRIGFEAMASGSVLIVDNRGGWRQMVDHGITGWLCDHERDFIYYASTMAYEPQLRSEMAEAARLRGLELGGLEASKASWEEVFETISRLPE
jgi:glycosyltransferase involved in cell wall biosynthesis